MHSLQFPPALPVVPGEIAIIAVAHCSPNLPLMRLLAIDASRIFDNANHACTADSIFLCNVGQRHSRERSRTSALRSTLSGGKGTPEAASFDLGAAHSGSDALDDQRPFQFRNRPDKRDEHAAPIGRAGVDSFPREKNSIPSSLRFVHDFEEILRAAGDPVEGINRNDGELPLAGRQPSGRLALGVSLLEPEIPRSPGIRG